jgi:2-polyprenyl-6-methoxyphenol hydroxylase-like FAD-dependent oxidoreductase
MTGRILVVGGGIAGFALLRALRLRGLDATLAEQAPAPTAPGHGLNLPGNALRALAALGVADQVVARGARVTRREYRTSTGRLLFAVDEAAFWRGIGPSVCVRRGVLLDLLRDGADGVRWGTTVSAAEPGADQVRVRLDPGGDETFDLVTGADGVHSVVRTSVLGEGGPARSLMTEASWRFLTPDPGLAGWTVWTGRRGTLLLIPVGDGLAYGYASTTSGGGAGSDPAWLAMTFAAFAEPVPAAVNAALADPGSLYWSPVEEVRVPRWHRGRMILVGDAAHATGPVWAQGAALACEDALVLARLLAERDDWGAVGAEFERLRRPRVAHVQVATDRMSRLAGLPTGLRNLVAPVLGPRNYRAAYGPLRGSVE